MNNRVSYFRRCLVLSVLSLIALPLPLGADDAPVSDLESWVRKIESRGNAWTAYRAKIALEFANAKNEGGTCRGDLTYDRLNEKMLLRCSDDRNQLLFVFKTADTRFELYLAGAQTVYRGDMFQAEDTDTVESQLEPLALYRSLKLMAIPEDKAEITSEGNDGTVLSLWTRKDNVLYVSRMITATPDGDVIAEGYYDSKKIARATIHRSDFRAIEDEAKLLPGPVYFPYHIRLITRDRTGENEKTTRMVFEDISLLPSVEKSAWSVSYPGQTSFVDL